MIVKQILLSSTLGNVWRSVWRICKLMLGCKELSYSSTEQDHVKSVRLRQMVADILCTLLLTKSQQISYQRKACNSASPRKISVFQFWYKWQLTFPSETLTVPIVWIVPDQYKTRSSYKEMSQLNVLTPLEYVQGVSLVLFAIMLPKMLWNGAMVKLGYRWWLAGKVSLLMNRDVIV